jgi:hypothetical protein
MVGANSVLHDGAAEAGVAVTAIGWNRPMRHHVDVGCGARAFLFILTLPVRSEHC